MHLLVLPQSVGAKARSVIPAPTMKSLIHGTWTSGGFNATKFDKSILLFRNMPRSGGASPAQLIFNCPVRDCLLAHCRSFAPEWQKAANILEKMDPAIERAANRVLQSKDAAINWFVVGNHVLIQHPDSKLWNTPSVIVEVGKHRDYLIKTPAGRIFRRNR
ncbi:hypothetical protein DAPPUDRAFT_329818 [Daphnia pulex]|uniref:Uncharacterized protein n=1 Tax=Daphnia pulex TaxID=6669 RepID=E9HHQ0_DAPPU|nr:hypothetical protein DAPPUDRAFT_329818 [Daphnia pulex]|eukprot:EFX68754.1 hypothetical protein DAPPUDRAFT_329818 [Daphnia pulex]